MGDDSSETFDEDSRLRDLPRVWWAWMKQEWRDRTAFGKLLYPIWFLWSAMQWALALFFFGFMAASKKIVESSKTETKTIPDEWVYKDD